MGMDDCIFCKIVAGEIPSRTVYADEGYIAFLAIPPRNLGHVLVIPRKHHRWVWDLPAASEAQAGEPNIGQYMEAAQKVARAQKKAFDTDWVVAAIAGEEVHHAHIWLVPRFDDDGHGGFLDVSNIKELSDDEMDAAAEKIRSALA